MIVLPHDTNSSPIFWVGDTKEGSKGRSLYCETNLYSANISLLFVLLIQFSTAKGQENPVHVYNNNPRLSIVSLELIILFIYLFIIIFFNCVDRMEWSSSIALSAQSELSTRY